MPYDIPDHPIIQNCERTGYPSGRTPEWPICPVCRSECSTIYIDSLNDIIGCDNCINEVYTDDDDNQTCPDCQPEPEKIYIKNGQVVGCENCIKTRDAWEWMAEQTYNNF